MTFQYHPEAAKELTSSIEYYEDKSEGLGEEFLDEVEAAISLILSHPETGTIITKEDHRILLNRFPYGLIYDVSNKMITINAVMHLSRRPEYWKSRK